MTKDPKKKSMIGNNVVPLPTPPQTPAADLSRMTSSQNMGASIITNNAGDDAGLGVLSQQPKGGKKGRRGDIQ